MWGDNANGGCGWFAPRWVGRCRMAHGGCPNAATRPGSGSRPLMLVCYTGAMWGNMAMIAAENG
jgi:hypothetical protein